MKSLYSEIEPTYVHTVAVESPHVLHVEECGNERGVPVVFLHGGPGSGSKPYHRQFFDPNRYRIVLFDQRGAGRSKPAGEISTNNTQALINDLETIRERLGIEKWVLCGSSWGATLALLYAETHPQNVLGIILRGTFLATQRDLDWFFKDGANRLFPDYWEEFCNVIPTNERHAIVAAYYQRIISGDEATRFRAAKSWSMWAQKIVTYTLPEESASMDDESREKIVNEAAIQCHYAVNNYFLSPHQIEENVSHLPDVPIRIIHGRRDITCTPDSAWILHKKLPQSRLIILPDAGHLANAPSMIDALINTTEELGARLANWIPMR
jgi:proline iminopeptidase